jgi:hypothetical protein
MLFITANIISRLIRDTGPIRIEIIEAVIELKTDKSNLRVMAINPQGFCYRLYTIKVH